MKIFIAGGTGFVGDALCRELRSRGHFLRLLVRGRGALSGEGVEHHIGDISRAETLAGAFADCDAVINLVGIIREFPCKGVTFEKLHVQAAKNITSMATEAGVSRFLHMSALGTREGAIAMYHRTKWEAEQIVRSSGLEWTIFRPSLIYGPGDAFVNMLADQVRNLPVVPVIGDGSYQLQPIFVKDVARCFASALNMRETVGKTYELCGEGRFSYLELLDIIGRVVGRKHVPKIKNPLGLMRLVTGFMQNLPFFPVTVDQIQMLTEGSVCDCSWKKVFGFEPAQFENEIGGYLSKR